MSHERITYWRCRHCHGTGRVIFAGNAEKCRECDGTGNGLIDGRAEEHKRQLAEIDRRKVDAMSKALAEELKRP